MIPEAKYKGDVGDGHWLNSLHSWICKDHFIYYSNSNKWFDDAEELKAIMSLSLSPLALYWYGYGICVGIIEHGRCGTCNIWQINAKICHNSYESLNHSILSQITRLPAFYVLFSSWSHTYTHWLSVLPYFAEVCSTFDIFNSTLFDFR